MALDMVESQFKVRLPESEAAFIAMHIANGETDDSTMEETFAITKSLRIYVISYVCTSVLRWMQTPATIIGLSHI